jgi:polysaccharide biosynthesis transport protein
MSNARKGFDWTTVFTIVLGYEKYLRLMMLLFCVGILVGTSLFVFKKGVYMSRSTIRISGYLDTSAIAVGERSAGGFRAMRSLLPQLASRNMSLEIAREMGVVSPESSWEDMRDNVISKVNYMVLDSNHLQIEVYSYDPSVVRRYPDALVATYDKWRLDQRKDYREKAMKRYLAELEEVRANIDKYLKERLEYQKNTDIAQTKVELDQLSTVPVDITRTLYRIEELDNLKGALEKMGPEASSVEKLSLLESVLASSKSRSSDHIGRAMATAAETSFAPTIIVEPKMVEGLLPWRATEKSYREMEQELREASETYRAGHPVMVDLRKRMEEAERKLDYELEVGVSKLDVELLTATTRLGEMKAKMPEYYEANQEFDAKLLDYELMEQAKTAWNNAYAQLWRDVNAMTYGSTRLNTELEPMGITALRDQVPVSPNKKSLAVMGAGLGLGLAFGLPFLLLRLNSSVSRIEDLESMLGVRGLGVVPITDPAILGQVNREPSTGSTLPNALLECFRLIRSGIILQMPEGRKSSIVMITSARPSEGKTTLATNLAWAFNAMGEKTLIVDCDLRRGRVHAFVGCEGSVGLAQMLDKGLAGISLDRSSVDFDVIPRGKIIQGATEKLNGEHFASLVSQWRKEYQRIIFDCPPVLGLSETSFLQKHCDGYVLVSRAEVTSKKDIYEACRILAAYETPFYGFVLNAVDLTKWSNMYQYDYYSPNYEYGENSRNV